MGPRVAALLIGVWLGVLPVVVDASSDSTARLEQLRQQIQRLELELERLKRDERGILGKLERLSAEIQLREVEQQAVKLEVDSVRESIAGQSASLATLREAQEQRRTYLQFRLREQYKAGENHWLRRHLDDSGSSTGGEGIRYASFLSSRDARILSEYRESEATIEVERKKLLGQEQELGRVSSELVNARKRLRNARSLHTTRLESIRTDSRRRETALAELRTAADDLGDWVGGFQEQGRRPAGAAGLDVRKFKGLLDWPGRGKVSSGFGTQIHPRFKTRVPHPGLDIEGSFGSPIHSVFEGEVVFAAWMRGYGLTAIVDHGSEVLSIYAHASALLVESGERVDAGQRIGLVGDSGSLRGSFLYFELREVGKPVDPARWLRPR
ncbi:MAG: peptidoglycan DD-metalloendopeptidase family protein [Acidobacteriota bacterium]|nr:peptidoglycan DD-metalloendopeptidase family protein [Acidobacteriota bacterium]MDH3785846.1 peptidoglycan DD-metalloendopeptidase family protein [Acidobacteriota bacterium]